MKTGIISWEKRRRRGIKNLRATVCCPICKRIFSFQDYWTGLMERGAGFSFRKRIKGKILEKIKSRFSLVKEKLFCGDCRTVAEMRHLLRHYLPVFGLKEMTQEKF